MLYIVSTPIGNLKDITYRAVETLKNVDLIAAEDTRHTKKLCQHYDIETPLTSYFEHNEMKKAEMLLKELRAGKNVALVSDAGTPGISDPGYKLINLAMKEHIPLSVIPGPTAAIAALSLSGLPTDRFLFDGFLPVKPNARRKKLEELKQYSGTIIFYESPHRLIKTLEDIAVVLDNPTVVVTREITKTFEEVKKAPARDLLAAFSSKPPKGEFVSLLHL